MTYTILQPPFTGKLREMSKKELRDYFRWFMEVLPERIKALAEVVKQTPGFESWYPDYTPSSLDRLGEWFASQVGTRKRTAEEIQMINDRLIFPMEISNEALTTRTFSLGMDVGMYLSQVLLKNHSSLKWDQPFGSRRFIDYGQPVLVKFGPAPFNPVRMVVTLAYGLVSQKKAGDGLRNLYNIWSDLIQ